MCGTILKTATWEKKILSVDLAFVVRSPIKAGCKNTCNIVEERSIKGKKRASYFQPRVTAFNQAIEIKRSCVSKATALSQKFKTFRFSHMHRHTEECFDAFFFVQKRLVSLKSKIQHLSLTVIKAAS